MSFKIDKGILGAFLMLVGLVALVGTLYFSQYIYAIVLGSVFQAVNGSGINITGATTNFLGTTEANFFSTVGFINNGALFAGGLIVVAVVLIVFGAILAMGRKKSGGKGDMGY